jgi:hypothetical protein
MMHELKMAEKHCPAVLKSMIYAGQTLHYLNPKEGRANMRELFFWLSKV